VVISFVRKHKTGFADAPLLKVCFGFLYTEPDKLATKIGHPITHADRSGRYRPMRRRKYGGRGQVLA